MATIYLPNPPKLDCDATGKISFKQLDEYFRTIGQIPNQLKIQADAVADDCGGDLIKAIQTMEKLIDDITGFLMTDVFKKLKSKEQEMEFKVREFFKEIDIFFQKKIVEILAKILKLLGVPNPLMIPIPFIGPVPLPDDKGGVENYQPKLGDLFTKAGKVKVKACIAYDVERIKKFFDIKGKYDGKLGIKSPEHEAEEVWQKIVAWIKKTLDDFIFSCAEAIVNVLGKIPIIGPILKKLLAAYTDPTVTVEQAFKTMMDEFKAKIEKSIDDVLSGKAAENLAGKIIDQLIDKILNFPIPLFGTLGAVLGISIEEEYKKKKVIFKESSLHKIEDAFEDTLNKIRAFFRGGFIKAIHDIILKAPGWILQNFPIVGKIFKIIQKIVRILTGKITICDVVNLILPPIFNLSKLMLAFIPSCVRIEYTEDGLAPK